MFSVVVLNPAAASVICHFYFFVFLGLHPQHMEVSRLGVKLELQLLARTTATAAPDPKPTEQGQGLNLYPRRDTLDL